MTVEARSFMPGGGGIPACTTTRLETTLDGTSTAIDLMAGAVIAVMDLMFADC